MLENELSILEPPARSLPILITYTLRFPHLAIDLETAQIFEEYVGMISTGRYNPDTPYITFVDVI
jgi:hypothetical protein